ncbi:hypothetical protein ABT369_53785 [Dactylosporangium sp. NPDC000244]|uniref:hypothetical protein n=1 Tax=Dactylosporangium sp. NPDC000244 TaxID=3154365 RepID=UPI00331719E7
MRQVLHPQLRHTDAAAEFDEGGQFGDVAAHRHEHHADPRRDAAGLALDLGQGAQIGHHPLE